MQDQTQMENVQNQMQNQAQNQVQNQAQNQAQQKKPHSKMRGKVKRLAAFHRKRTDVDTKKTWKATLCPCINTKAQGGGKGKT